jgi:hypothetical protein
VNSQITKQEQTAQSLTAALARLSQVEAELIRLAKAELPPPSQQLTRRSSLDPTPYVVPQLDSVIVSDFPPLFQEFRHKTWELLYRGSRDGFDPHDFHSRCDGHANTLTIIEDIHQFVFGGFTPVEWESRVWNGKMWEKNNCPKADDSMKTFIFTLRNPYDVPARKFSLKPDWKQYAIYCDGEQGPVFGVEADITVRRPCDTEFVSYTEYFGNTYVNDTGQEGNDFLTGSSHFRVNEIEVFELID